MMYILYTLGKKHLYTKYNTVQNYGIHVGFD